MRKSIYTNLQNRNKFFLGEKQQLALNSLKRQITSFRRFKKINKVQKVYLVSKTQLKNVCFLTGRSRGVLRAARLSRISFRFLNSMGLINGGQKIS